jgi:predicted  nucleic acid-binding Zn-ribbon protein
MKKRSEDTESLLKYRDDEITHLRKPYRSVEFDSIMQELQVVRQELERIKLEEIPKDTAALVQNIRQLLAEKTTILKSIRKSQSEYSSLTSEVARLKRECLDLNSKYTSEREENQRLKLQLESARSESLTYQREVNRLKDLIAEYVAKDDVQQLSETITSEEERQLVASEE